MSYMYLLAIYGVTFLIVDSTILARPREWLAVRAKLFAGMMECWFCSGFWVALAAHFWLDRHAETLTSYVESVVVGGFAGATFVYALNVLLLTLESSHDRPT